ncbi:tetratricopeptide repeat protein [Leptospira meyeri]|uniref:tetratricopeptide repeat protein n=1 Tax=Leptospira meyeri TaxID=29508 RepID=UPI0002BF093C|nr:hypothetical protein [Leptospira meyeri]EMJ90317.1 hypothetical protein LEP1GSC196_0180 [Leptospira meyeri serovar Semaranga str. Veldrot Semarang 173]
MRKILLISLSFLVYYSCGETKKHPLLNDADQAFVFGDLKNAELKINQILKEEPENQKAIFLRGKILFYTGRISEARNILVKLDEETLTKTETILLMSRINLALNQKQSETIDNLTSIIENQPLNLDALLIRGKLYETTGKIPEAIHDFQTIIQQTEKIRIAHISMANVYTKAKLMDKANQHLSLAKNLEKKGN